jgi:magnesium chelatase family protein
VTAADLALPPAGEGTTEVAARVAAAREVQLSRAGALNAACPAQVLESIATPDEGGRAILAKAAESLGLSARAYHRVLRVARTIADLEGEGAVRRIHVAEALGLRRIWAGAQASGGGAGHATAAAGTFR